MKRNEVPPPPVSVDPKKNAAMFNMFGDNPGKKEPEPVKQQVPPTPPVNKETNINSLFGTGPGQRVDPGVKSPGTRK